VVGAKLTTSLSAYAICPHCGASNAMPGWDELIAFVCRRCGNPVRVKPPAIQLGLSSPFLLCPWSRIRRYPRFFRSC